MKKILSICIALSIVSCAAPTRNLTIKYIKTEVEEHSPENISEINTMPILLYGNQAANTYLEMCGVKYKGEKFLIIGSDRFVLTKNETGVLNTTYFRKLSVQDCENIIVKSEQIWKDVLKSELKLNENAYADYTIQKDIFISVHNKGMIANRDYAIWVNGRKHFIEGYTFIKAIKKFLAY